MKAATAAVGLLAGIVAAVYVLGGLVVALRMLFDHFSPNAVVTIIAQLPRELVITTALLGVIGPAATVGLAAALLYGATDRPRSRGEKSDRLDEGRNALLLFAFFGLVSVVFALPSVAQALNTDGFSPLLLTGVFGILVTYGVVAACWYLLRGTGRKSWSRFVQAAAAGGLWAIMALTPAVMLASALPFEHAQICTSASRVPQRGLLIGEGGGRVLLERQFGEEASVVSLPSDEVTRSEYGDLSSIFACPPPEGGKVAVKQAEAELGGHGSKVEQLLARALRPRLRFDSRERWRPLEVRAFLGERFADGGHRACPPGGEPDCSAVIGIGELKRRPGAPAFIDVHGDEKRPSSFTSPHRSCRPQGSVVVDCNGGPLSAIYYRRTTHEHRWYWDYWWYYRYNDYIGKYNECDVYCDDHEGDWEGMTVITTPSLEPRILGAIYAAHADRVHVGASILPLAGSHPLAFVADGTHATYPFRCDGKRQCQQYADFLGITLPEDSHDGAVAWGGNLDAECISSRCVRPLPEIGHPRDAAAPLAGAWAGWPGRWGGTCQRGGCHGELDGPSPASPGNQVRFECPWVANRKAKPAADGSGASDSEASGDFERLLAICRAQRGGR